jgi:hypothetical protein
MRVNRLLLLSMLAAGCQGPLAPDDSLRGHFSNADARLDVSGSVVVFTARCQHAEFAPIVLDANREFSAESVVYDVTGNILHSPGDKLHIQGHFVGPDLVLQLYVVRAEPPVSDPYVITLAPGSSTGALVCNASG